MTDSRTALGPSTVIVQLLRVSVLDKPALLIVWSSVKTLCYTVNFHICWSNYYLLFWLIAAIVTASPSEPWRDEWMPLPSLQFHYDELLFVMAKIRKDFIKATGTTQQLLNTAKAWRLHNGTRLLPFSHIVQSGICNGWNCNSRGLQQGTQRQFEQPRERALPVDVTASHYSYPSL